MPQEKSQATDDQDPGQLLREESNQGRREEEGGAPPPDRAQDDRDGRVSQDRSRRDGLRGRQPSPEPDVFMDVPSVKVEEIYLDVEGLDAHLSLRTKLANLVQLVAGVHVHCGKVELDIKGVDAQAMLKVRLENLYDILDRALTTIDRNPQILEALLKTVDTAVDDIGQTAQTALGPQGAVSRTVDQVGQTAQTALGPGGAGTQALDQVGGAAKEAVGPGGAVTQTGQKVGAAVDDTGQAVGGVATGVGAGVGQGAGQAADQVGQAVGQAGQAGAQATEQVGQTARDATAGPQDAGEDAGQRHRPASRRAREGETKRGSKRGTRRSSSSQDEDGERGRVVRSATKVGHVAQQAIGRLAGSGTGQAAEEATEQVRQAAEEAVQQVGQAAAKATEQVGQAAVEASGKASFTPKNSDEAHGVVGSGGDRHRAAQARGRPPAAPSAARVRGPRRTPASSSSAQLVLVLDRKVTGGRPTAGNDRGTRPQLIAGRRGRGESGAVPRGVGRRSTRETPRG